MNYAQARDLPGTGDCFRPVDPDYDAMIEMAKNILISRWLYDTEQIVDAQSALSDDEYRRINVAIIVGDDTEAGRTLRLGVHRVISERAAEEARKNFRRILRDLED